MIGRRKNESKTQEPRQRTPDQELAVWAFYQKQEEQRKRTTSPIVQQAEANDRFCAERGIRRR